MKLLPLLVATAAAILGEPDLIAPLDPPRNRNRPAAQRARATESPRGRHRPASDDVRINF
jgi:hypothetical protein